MSIAVTRTLEEKIQDELEYERLVEWMKGLNEPGRMYVPEIYVPPPPPSDPPKWRGAAERFFRINGPNPHYTIDHRARTIAWSFVILERNEDDSSDDEDEDEARVLRRKGYLDELQAYDVESIDLAKLLHSDGDLVRFLSGVLSNKHSCIRAKAAELITSMVQNHPTSQQLVIEGNGIQLLLRNFTTDPDTTSMIKALGAISSLILNNKSGITVFLRENGYEALRNALNSGTVLAAGSSTHNEVDNLIGYLRRESSSYLKFGDDSEVQEARKGGKNDDNPKQDNWKKRRNYSVLKRLKPFTPSVHKYMSF